MDIQSPESGVRSPEFGVQRPESENRKSKIENPPGLLYVGTYAGRLGEAGNQETRAGRGDCGGAFGCGDAGGSGTGARRRTGAALLAHAAGRTGFVGFGCDLRR